jgi:DNA polymerase-3 subunit epsilon
VGAGGRGGQLPTAIITHIHTGEQQVGKGKSIGAGFDLCCSPVWRGAGLRPVPCWFYRNRSVLDGVEPLRYLLDMNGNELRRRAQQLLATARQPLAETTLIQHLFNVRDSGHRTGAVWRELLRQILGPSGLFIEYAPGCWGLRAWQRSEQVLSELEYVVIDVEATGLRPGNHRLIEVAGLRARGAVVLDTFQSLINPQRPLPRFITAFTGITPEMVASAAPAAEVLPRLLEFLGDHLIVGHNVSFDLGFLDHEAARLGLSLPMASLDTITLARCFVPELRRYKLDILARYLGVAIHDRHRAPGDARITQEVFVLLLERARAAGLRTLGDLERYLYQARADTGARTIVAERPTGGLLLNPAWRQQFPARPGVYLMKDEHGEVIYVGKARSLKDRLASYYAQPLGYTRKMDGLLQAVKAIEVRMLSCELEALLVESQLIKTLQPRFNVQLRHYEHYPFIKVDVQSRYPRVYATREVIADGARYFGPFRSGRAVETVLDIVQKLFAIRTCTRGMPPASRPSEPCLRYHLKRCLAPCRGNVDPETYRAIVADVCAFLGGEREDLLARLRREMWAAAAQHDYERAAQLRDMLRSVDRVLIGQRLLAGAVEAHNLLIVYPAAEGGGFEAFLVRHGRLIAQRRLQYDEVSLEEALTELVRRAAALGDVPPVIGKEEVDQINIIARWIHLHSDDRAFIPLPADLSDMAAVSALMATVRQRLGEMVSEP